jgi:hypothetical protein
VTFLPAFAAPLQTWMDIYTPTADSGWSQEGSWTVTAPPDIVSVFSVTPCCGGHGANQNFVFKYADTSGGGNIQTAWAWFTPAYNSGNAAHISSSPSIRSRSPRRSAACSRFGGTPPRPLPTTAAGGRWDRLR